MKYPGLFLFMALGVALVVTGCTTGQLDRAILQRVVQDDEPAGVSEIAANEVALQRKPLATMDPVPSTWVATNSNSSRPILIRMGM